MAVPVPTIDEFGITVPTYDEVHDYVRAAYRGIYGEDIYIEPDSQDGQFLAILSLALHDAYSVSTAVYNAFSPTTAQGVGLSRVVKINGIERHISTRSSVDVKVTGVTGTTIVDGIASDGTNRWLLPASVTIPASGEITVTATAELPGALLAPAGSVETISTPTRGWQEITNPLAATPGAPVESDAALRFRQTISTALPSRTVLEGMVGAVADVEGVTRYSAFENDGPATNSEGIPGHSVAFVVEGGDATAIAAAIAAKKAPGTQTYGTTSVTIADTYAIPRIIKFYRPTVVPIAVEITIKAFGGYTITVENRIKSFVVDYLNGVAVDPDLDPSDIDVDQGQKIGESVYPGRLFTAANLYNKTGLGSRTFKVISIYVTRLSDPASNGDIPLSFNEVTSGDIANVAMVITP